MGGVLIPHGYSPKKKFITMIWDNRFVHTCRGLADSRAGRLAQRSVRTRSPSETLRTQRDEATVKKKNFKNAFSVGKLKGPILSSFSHL